MRKPKPPKNAFWRGDVLWGRKRIGGEIVRWSLRTSKVEVARRRVAQDIERLVDEARYGNARRTYEEAYIDWSQWIAAQTSANTARRYDSSLSQIERHLRPRWIDEIDKPLIARIVAERRAAGRSSATIRRDLTALSSILGFACDQGWREGNPALEQLTRTREKRDPLALPTDSDIAQVMAVMPRGFADIVRAALMTGCRQEELVTADRRRLDRARKQLTVIGKGNKLRVVQLSDEAFRHLAGLPASVGTTSLFHHSGGASYRNVASRFRAYVLRAQNVSQEKGTHFQPFRFHDLRHRYAVDYLKNGGNIYRLQKQLGHTSVKTTEGYLEHLTAEEAEVAMFGSRAPEGQNEIQERRFDESATGETSDGATG